MQTRFVNFIRLILLVFFLENAAAQLADAKYLSGTLNKIEFEDDKAAENSESKIEQVKINKRETNGIPKDLGGKKDVSQLESICSFYKESYTSMESPSGKLTPVKKFRYVPLCCPGYVKAGIGNDEDPYKCVPACDSCNYGMCMSPNRCKCDDGYENPSGNVSTCVPKCFPPCRNSHCAGPDLCVCDKGFVNDEFFPNQCIKIRRYSRMSDELDERKPRKRESLHLRDLPDPISIDAREAMTNEVNKTVKRRFICSPWKCPPRRPPPRYPPPRRPIVIHNHPRPVIHNHPRPIIHNHPPTVIHNRPVTNTVSTANNCQTHQSNSQLCNHVFKK